jgi:hypothetical protein
VATKTPKRDHGCWPLTGQTPIVERSIARLTTQNDQALKALGSEERLRSIDTDSGKRQLRLQGLCVIPARSSCHALA